MHIVSSSPDKRSVALRSRDVARKGKEGPAADSHQRRTLPTALPCQAPCASSATGCHARHVASRDS